MSLSLLQKSRPQPHQPVFGQKLRALSRRCRILRGHTANGQRTEHDHGHSIETRADLEGIRISIATRFNSLDAIVYLSAALDGREQTSIAYGENLLRADYDIAKFNAFRQSQAYVRSYPQERDDQDDQRDSDIGNSNFRN